MPLAPPLANLTTSLQSTLKTFNFTGKDISNLSALAYVDAFRPFSYLSIQGAIARVNPDEIVEGATATEKVNTRVRDAVVREFLRLHNAKPVGVKGNDIAVLSAFFGAGTAGFVEMLNAHVKNEYKRTLSAEQTGRLTDLFEKMRLALENVLQSPTPDPRLANSTTAFEFFEAMTEIINSSVLQLFADKQERDFVFDTQPMAGFLQLAVMPFFRMALVLEVAKTELMSFMDKVMARFLFYKMLASALTQLKEALPATSPWRRDLSIIIDTVGGIMDTRDFTSSELNQRISLVNNYSKNAKDASESLRAKNAVMQQRLDRARDMQVNFNVDAQDVSQRFAAFVAWIIAYVIVVAASVYLIVSNHLSEFMLLALISLALIFLYLCARFVSFLIHHRVRPARLDTMLY